MIKIFISEFKSLWRNIKAAAAMAAFALVGGILLQYFCLGGGSGNLSAFSASLIMFGAFAVPLMAADSFLRDRKTEKYDLYASLPFGAKSIFFGKLFANLVFSLIPVAVIAVFPLVLSLLGSEEMKRSYLSLLVVALAVVFLMCFCMMLSALVKKDWVYYVVSYASTAFLLALRFLSSMLPEAVGKYIDIFVVFRRSSDLSLGIFDISFVVFLLAASCIFAMFGYAAVKKMLPKAGKQSKMGVKLALRISAVVLCVALNVGMTAIPASLLYRDMTPQGFYDIGAKTKSYVGGLKDDVEIYIITNGGESESTYLLEKYAALSKKIKLTKINVMTDGEFIENNGLDGNVGTVMLKCGDRREVLPSGSFYYYDGSLGRLSLNEYAQLLLTCEQIIESEEASTEEKEAAQEVMGNLYSSKLMINAENTLNQALAVVTSKVYYTEGHGEESVSNAKAINLGKVSEIPEGADEVIINSPDKDFTDHEIKLLKGFSESGGRILFLSNEKVTTQPKLTALFEELYGVGVSGSYSSIKADVSEALQDLCGSQVTLEGACGIELLTKKENVKVKEILTHSVTEKDEKGNETTSSVPVALFASKNSKYAFAWLSGAESYNKEMAVPKSNASDEEISKYQNLLSLNVLREFSSECLLNISIHTATAKNASPAGIQTESTWAIVFNIIFIGVIPLSIFGTALLIRYSRKRQSRMTPEE